VTLKVRDRLEIPIARLKYAHFIESGIASVVLISGTARRPAEVGLIGREGMLLHDAGRASCEISMHLEGAALRIEAAALREAIERSISLRSLLLRYAYLFGLQIAHTAAANAHGSIIQRLSRWLLMAHDRIDGDTLHFTQEFLSTVLSVRRAGVMGALELLQSRRCIETGRGSITVVDREALRACSCGLYGEPEAHFADFFGAVRQRREKDVRREKT